MAKRGPFLKFTSDDKEWIASLNRSVAATEKLEQALKEVATKGKQSGKQIQSAFKGASSGAASFITQAISVTAVIGKITQAFGEMTKAQEEAFAGIEEAELPFSKLAQVAAGDPDKLRTLINESKALFLQGGAASLGGAADITFALQSAGLLSQRRLFGELFGVFEDPEGLAGALTTITTSFGEKEAGTFKNIIGKGLAASAEAKSTVASILVATAKPAVAAEKLGLSDEETAAAVTVLTKAIGTTEEAGTTARSFFEALLLIQGVDGVPLEIKQEQLAAQGLTPKEISDKLKGKIEPLFEGRGQGLSSIVAQIDELDLTAAQLKQFFPKKASVGLGVLAPRLELFEQILAGVEAAGEIDVDRAVRARLLQPEIVAARDRRKGAAQRVIGQEQLGVAEAVAQDVEDRILARTAGGLKGGIQRVGLGIFRRALPSDVFVDVFGQGGGGVIGAAQDALRFTSPFLRAVTDPSDELLDNPEARKIDRLQGALEQHRRLGRGIGESPEFGAFIEEKLRPTRVLGDDLKGPS